MDKTGSTRFLLFSQQHAGLSFYQFRRKIMNRVYFWSAHWVKSWLAGYPETDPPQSKTWPSEPIRVQSFLSQTISSNRKLKCYVGQPISDDFRRKSVFLFLCHTIGRLHTKFIQSESPLLLLSTNQSPTIFKSQPCLFAPNILMMRVG